MFTIAICDDNKQDCSNLCNMVEQYFCGKQKIELHSFQSGLVLYQFMKSQNVHLVIMDIMLDNQSGIDIVKQLKYIAPDCKIIFVSINPEYFQDVYYVDHISFLMDWKIIFQTVMTVLKRDGISSETAATMEMFTGTAENVDSSKKKSNR